MVDFTICVQITVVVRAIRLLNATRKSSFFPLFNNLQIACFVVTRLGSKMNHENGIYTTHPGNHDLTLYISDLVDSRQQ